MLTPLVARRAARIVGAPLVRLFGEPARRAASLAVLDAVSSEH